MGERPACRGDRLGSVRESSLHGLRLSSCGHIFLNLENIEHIPSCAPDNEQQRSDQA